MSAVTAKQKKAVKPTIDLPEREARPAGDLDLSSVKNFLKIVNMEDPPPVEYRPADLRPGYVLVTEFSRPSKTKKVRRSREEKLASKDAKTEATEPSLSTIEKHFDTFSWKIVNNAYAQLLAHFPHLPPFGFFCEPNERAKVFKVLANVKQVAEFLNKYVREQKLKRKVTIDVFPIKWDVNDERVRMRVSEMVVSKLLDVRRIYTSRNMTDYRVQMERVKHMDKLLAGEQSSLVRDALLATQQQRKVMIAIYGDKIPTGWIDPLTRERKTHIRLDFGPIDKAIKCLCPDWDPEQEDALPF